jgi:hypothetical protein
VIEAAGLATLEADLFLGTLPSNPTLCCALAEYAGEPPLRTQNEGHAHSSAQGGERPRVQLLCRATDYEAGRSLIQSILGVLDAIVNQTILGTFYLKVAAVQPPFLLERDQNDRWIFAVNFAVTKAV